MGQEVNYDLQSTRKYSPHPEIANNRKYWVKEKGRKNEAVRRSRSERWRSGK
jgi:hypothetical protein